MRILLTIVFFFAAPLLRSQPYSHSDTSLWDSPLTPQQVLSNGVKKVIIKRTGWCAIECSAPWYGTLTTSYNYDAYGYPVSFSAQGCRDNSEFMSENIYSDGQLVKSVLKQKDYLYKMFEQSFNSQNLPDSCSWITNGQDDRATAYTYDSLLRIRKTNYYEASGGRSFSRKKEVEVFYNAHNFPIREISTSNAGVEWQTTFHYRRNFRVSKVITRNAHRKKVKVVKTYYIGKHKRKIKVVPKRLEEYFIPYEIRKISRKNGQVIYREYQFYWLQGCIPYRKFIERSVYDGSTGLLIKKVYPRKRSRDPGPKRVVLVEFSYIK